MRILNFMMRPDMAELHFVLTVGVCPLVVF